MDAAPPTPGARGEQSYRTPGSRSNGGSSGDERRRRLQTRSAPIGVLAAASFLAGVVVGGPGGGSEAAARFADAWERQDFTAMHAELSSAAQEAYPVEEFTKLYVDAQATATAVRVVTGETEEAEVDGSDAAAFEATVDTRAFGQVGGRVELPLAEEGLVAWEPHLTFPGLAAGERLDRTTRAGERAPLLARDGSALAEGPATARTSPLGASALAIAGSVGSPSRKQQRELFALGHPAGTLAGTSGLELAFNSELAGQPSGQLLAVNEAKTGGERILASADPVAGNPVKTTIDPEIQSAAVTALGATYGGVAVLDARNGDVLGVAGLAFSAPQPPGSTFKVITATAGLDEGAVKLSDTFPVEVSNSLIGREISNAHDSACGGTFTQAFAQSCNTVFAPLGVEIGADAMFEKSELFGFNSPPALTASGALEALAPPASTYPLPDSEIAVGESAIGQGQVLATPLQMASISQTIANKGKRSATSIVKGPPELRPEADPVEVTSPETAATMKDLMIEVVRSGTGVAAQVPGVAVAGKTGTAELGPASLEPGQTLAPGEDPPQKENAWFTAFAPADKPRLAIAVLVVEATGGGGAVAAPIAQQVLASVLG
jgi:beta-lactamase class D